MSTAHRFDGYFGEHSLRQTAAMACRWLIQGNRLQESGHAKKDTFTYSRPRLNLSTTRFCAADGLRTAGNGTGIRIVPQVWVIGVPEPRVGLGHHSRQNYSP